MISRFVQHIRYAARVLTRAPVFTLTAVASLAVGIGANTTIFTVANALLFAPTAGLRDPGALVDIGRTRGGQGFDTVSFPTYADLRHSNTVFSDMYAARFEARAVSFGAPDGAERVYADEVSASYFDVLGVVTAAGTFFHGGDEQVGVPLRKIVLTHAFWTSHFRADAGVIGREAIINGDRFTIIGVAAAGFSGTTIVKPDLWIPLTAYARATPDDHLLRSRESLWLVMGARLKPGTSIAQARLGLGAAFDELKARDPEIYRDLGLAIMPMSRVPGEAGSVAAPVVWVLATIVGLVLLIACTNLAGLMLARAAMRSREIAVRLALGSSRADLVSLLLAESVVLFSAGGLAALGVARVMTHVLWSLIPSLPVPIQLDLSIDYRVLIFAFALALAAGLVTGLAPALQSSRPSLVGNLKGESTGPSRRRLRKAFLAAQLALCFALLVVAGLFLRAFGAASQVQPGFDVDPIEVASVDLSLGAYDDVGAAAVREDIRARLGALPGIARVAASAVVPLGGDGLGLGALRKSGTSEVLVEADWNVVTADYFDTMALPLVRGRAFSSVDRAGALDAVIVNEHFASALWPGENPVGKTLENGDFRPGRTGVERVLTIVGVARDSKSRWLGDEPRNFVYVPMAQWPWRSVNFLLRRHASRADSANLASEIRAVLKQVDPNLPLVRVISLGQIAAIGLLPQQLAASVAGSLGSVALLLAGIGLYGVTAFAVARRTREIGVRMALGAEPSRVVWMVLAQSLGVTAIGTLAGLALATALAQVISNMLFGVSPIDPVAFGATAVLLFLVAAAASYVPARRAARINPLLALRAD